MRNRIYLLLAALLLCSFQLQAQTLENIAQRQSNPEQRVNGVVATFSSFAEGRATTEGILRYYGVDDDENEIGSFLINPSTGTFIGYSLFIERLPDPNKLKITIKAPPADAGDSLRKSVFGALVQQRWPNKSNFTVMPPASYPEPIVINLTDVIKIPLWVKAGTEWGVIGDQIRFAIDKPKPARDFTLKDVALKLTNFRLIINGEVRSGERELKGFESPLPSFYVPGKGAFTLSLIPREAHILQKTGLRERANIQKIGVAEGKKISFTYGGDKYEWVSSEPVIPFGGKWNIWVLNLPESVYQEDSDLLEAYKLLSKGNCCTFFQGNLGDDPKPSSPKK
jgi:hypothetical protein